MLSTSPHSERVQLQMIVLLCRDLIISDEVEVAGLSAILSAKSVPPQGASG